MDWSGTIYDISVVLGKESIDFPGDEPFARKWTQRLQEGGVCDLTSLCLSAHAGAHLDSPAHFLPGGKTLDRYPLRDFMRPAQVVEIQDPECVRPGELEPLEIKEGDALLFKTENSQSGRSRSGVFSERFVYLSGEAAEWCVRHGVGLVGLDAISIERYGDERFPAHRRLMENGVLILEGIHLGDVPPGRYTLLCLPLKLEGCEASPVRAVLID
jgi:arylformamidase